MDHPEAPEPVEEEAAVEQKPANMYFLATVEVSYSVAKTIVASRKYNVIHLKATPDMTRLDLAHITEAAMSQFLKDGSVPKTAKITHSVILSMALMGYMTEDDFAAGYAEAQAAKLALLQGK